MTVELKSRLWVDHRSEKWTNNRPIKTEAIPLTTQQSEFQSSYYSAIQGATGLKLYYVIAYQKVDEQHI